jgi:diacylglycerol kinase family enzyme
MEGLSATYLPAATVESGEDRQHARPRVLALVNVEGRAAATMGGGEVLKARVAQAFTDAGVEATVELVSGAGLPAALRKATDGGFAFDALAVGGGDGTIGTAAAHLAGTGIPLGVLPLGTLNHFARDLRVPPVLELACVVIAEGHARAIDLAEINGHVFVNNASIGIYPYMVETRERQRRTLGLGKWGAMALAFLWMVRRFPVHRLAIRTEDDVHVHKTPCAFIGNNRYMLDGPAFGTRAALDRGELCLYVARSHSRFQLLLVMIRAILGRMMRERDFEAFAARGVAIESRARRLRVAVDGELVKMQPPLHCTIRPGALRVLVPRVTV